MAALRASLIVVALVGFFLLGTPLQWLIARRAPRLAHVVPLAFCRTLLWLMKVRVTVDGERLTGQPVLMASNHVSWIDILALGGITPFCFLAKSDIAGWPIVSAFAEVQGTVFVDRRRRRGIPQANRHMAARMLEGRPVLLFPEGTTIGGREPGPFRSSHFAAARELLRLAPARGEVAVQPIAIAYSSEAAAWVGDDDLLSHLWRTLRAPSLRCEVRFGPPCAYALRSDRKAVARLTRECVVELLRSAPRAAPLAEATLAHAARR